VNGQTLTDATARETSSKFAAMRHFFRFIRPGAMRVGAQVSGSTSLLASAYVHDGDGTLTVVLVNAGASAATVAVQLPAQPAGLSAFELSTSSDGALARI